MSLERDRMSCMFYRITLGIGSDQTYPSNMHLNAISDFLRHAADIVVSDESQVMYYVLLIHN